MTNSIMRKTRPGFRRFIGTLPIVVAICLLSACASGPPPYQSSAETRLAAERLLTQDESEIRRRWGDLADVVGTEWVWESNKGFLFVSPQWVIKGSVMSMYHAWHEDAERHGRVWTLQFNPAENRIGAYTIPYGGQFVWNLNVQADGSVVSDSTIGGSVTYRFDRSDKVLETIRSANDKQKYRRITRAQYDAMVENMRVRHGMAASAKERESQAFRQGLYGALKGANQGLQQETARSQASLNATIDNAQRAGAANEQVARQRQAEEATRQARSSAQAHPNNQPVAVTSAQQKPQVNVQAVQQSSQFSQNQRSPAASSLPKADVGNVALSNKPSTAETKMIDFKEGVVVCPAGKKHAWVWGEQICEGPFQNALVNLKSSNFIGDLANACGSGKGSIRELGTYDGHRVFGCGFGINPQKKGWPNRDTAAKFGLVVPPRQTYRCPDTQDGYCMTR